MGHMSTLRAISVAADLARAISSAGPRVAKVPRWRRPQAALPAESGDHFAA